MFDEVRSSHKELPGSFQTKDLDCFMMQFYLDPIGRLWSIDYGGTCDLTFSGAKLNATPNGNRGKVYPVYHNGELVMTQVRVSPDETTDLYHYTLQFTEGVLQSFCIS